MRNASRVLLLFDFSNCLFKAIATMQQLSFAGKFTGGVFGFINQFIKNLKLHQPTAVAVCMDAPPYLRKDFFPEYKADRKKNDLFSPENIKESVEFCNEFLDLLNVPIFKELGHEADDLFAYICKQYHKEFDKIVIVSSDDDLSQLFIYRNVYLQKKNKLYGYKDFVQEFQIEPEDWYKVTAMSGGHNNLKGLPGIGVVKAIKVLRENKYAQIYDSNKEMMGKYLRLAKIPFEAKSDAIFPLGKTSFPERKIINFYSRLGMTLTSEMIKSFEVLNGEFVSSPVVETKIVRKGFFK